MSVYVGIDVHRKRSQIAVVDQDGAVRVNRNVPNGVGTVLSVIGELPIGAPVAVEAASGWGRLVELLEDYGFEPHRVHPLRCTAIASARLKNDKGRRRPPRPVAARRSAPRGVDRPASGPPAAGPAAPPLPAGPAAYPAAPPRPRRSGGPGLRPRRRLLHRSGPGLAYRPGPARMPHAAWSTTSWP